MAKVTDTRRRQWWIALTVAVIAVGLLAFFWPGRAAPPAPMVERAVVPPAPAAAAAPARQPAPAPAPLPTPPPEATGRVQPSMPPPPPLPPTTQALEEEFFPGTTEWEVVPLDESKKYLLRILPARYNVVAPMPIAVYLEVMDLRGVRQPLQNPHVRVRPMDDASKGWIEVPVRDDGTGADQKAGDRQYTATLQPTGAQQKALLGRVMVEGSVDVPGVGTRVIPATLIYTLGPRARLTGRWNDSVRDGHLYLEAELEVEEAGLFTLMAQIFGPSMEPIAWVKQTAHLDKGRGTMTLQVFGKVIHDSGIDGPYRVREVLLSRDRENSADYDPGVTIEEAYRTKAYSARQFSADAYQEPPRVLPQEITADSPSQRDKPPPLKNRRVH